MKVLTFTSLFPNSSQRELGVFIQHRTEALSKTAGTSVQVIAPVPYCPPWLAFGPWREYRQIPSTEKIGHLEVWHPRYPLVPGISMFFHGFLMFLGALPTARKLHRQFAFDCIDAHYVYPDGFAAVLLARALGIPVIVSARGSDINLFPSFRLIRPMVSWTLRKASGLIAVSSALGHRMTQLGARRENIRIIPNGIDLAQFEPMDRMEARRSLGLALDGPIVISVGSLVPAKRHDLVIRAVARIAPGMPDIKAHIVGEGSERSALQALIHELRMDRTIFLHGRRPHAELRQWFSAGDLCCLLSAREGWPNVLMESLSCGTPVIATRVGGIPEIIVSEELGILVGADPQSVASALLQGLDRKWDRQKLVQHIQKRTWSVVAGEVYEYLAAVTTMALAAERN